MVRMKALRPLRGEYSGDRVTLPGEQFECPEDYARSLETRNLAVRMVQPGKVKDTVEKMLRLRKRNETKDLGAAPENKSEVATNPDSPTTEKIATHKPKKRPRDARGRFLKKDKQ